MGQAVVLSLSLPVALCSFLGLGRQNSHNHDLCFLKNDVSPYTIENCVILSLGCTALQGEFLTAPFFCLLWLGRCFPRIPKRVTTTLELCSAPARVIPGHCSEPAAAPGPGRDFHVFCPAFFSCSPRPRAIYFYAVVACSRTAHLSLFVFIPSACLSTVETKSSGKVETNVSAPCPGHRAAEKHKQLNRPCSTPAAIGVSTRTDPGSSGMSQHAHSRDIAPYSRIYTSSHPTHCQHFGFLAVGTEGLFPPCFCVYFHWVLQMLHDVGKEELFRNSELA